MHQAHTTMISMRWEVAGRAWQSAPKKPARRGPGGSHGAPRRALRPPRSPQTAKGDSWPPFFECARCAGSRGGAGGSRTPDLLNAIQALSQLSYSPDGSRKLSPGPWAVKSSCAWQVAARFGRSRVASQRRAARSMCLLVAASPHGMFARPPAGVAELAYAGHSKCPGPCGLVGSNPTSGTNVRLLAVVELDAVAGEHRQHVEEGANSACAGSS